MTLRKLNHSKRCSTKAQTPSNLLGVPEVSNPFAFNEKLL